MNQKIHVMVVDDEEVFARNIARLLESRGFKASVALDGYAALTLLQGDKQKTVNVVLLDVKMPGMDGNEVLSRIKSNRPGVEVIMLTGHGDVDSGVNAIREGAFDYLLKPCDVDALMEKIEEAVTAEEMKRHPVLWPRKLVKEVTDAAFQPLDISDSLSRALDIFESFGDRFAREELHVTDGVNHLRGVITKGDIMAVACLGRAERLSSWEELATHPEWLPQMTVGEIMNPAPEVYAQPDEALTAVAQRMIDHKIRTLPVIDKSINHVFLGIIQLKDVLDHVACREEESDFF